MELLLIYLIFLLLLHQTTVCSILLSACWFCLLFVSSSDCTTHKVESLGHTVLANTHPPQQLLFLSGKAHSSLDWIGQSPHWIQLMQALNWIEARKCKLPHWMESCKLVQAPCWIGSPSSSLDSGSGKFQILNRIESGKLTLQWMCFDHRQSSSILLLLMSQSGLCMLKQPYCFLTVEGKHAKGKGFEIALGSLYHLLGISNLLTPTGFHHCLPPINSVWCMGQTVSIRSLLTSELWGQS
jgi:hypothetical protein